MTRFKVGYPIDILDYGDGLPGIETHAWELLNNLSREFPDRLELELYQDPETPLEPFDSFPVVPFPAATGIRQLHSFRRIRFLRNRGIDILHFLSAFGVPHRFRNYSVIMTVHDLIPELMPSICRNGATGSLQNISDALHRTNHFITISESTASDLMVHFDISIDRITVVFCGVGPDYKPDKTNLDEFRKTEALDFPFVLHVGTIEPRKNIPLLLEAFHIISDSIPHRIVLVGKPGWGAEQVEKTVRRLNIADRVVFKSYVPEIKLPAYYNAADLFVFPTKYEGFGIPLLEAMASGTPAIASNISSIPEIAGNPPAALLVEPENIQALADAMLRVLTTPSLASELSERGFERSSFFSWRRTAEETLSLYERVLNHGW